MPCLSNLKSTNFNRIQNFLVMVDGMTLHQGLLGSMPLIFTEHGLLKLKADIKNDFINYIVSALCKKFTEDYAIQSAINNGLSRIQLLTKTSF